MQKPFMLFSLARSQCVSVCLSVCVRSLTHKSTARVLGEGGCYGFSIPIAIFTNLCSQNVLPPTMSARVRVVFRCMCVCIPCIWTYICGPKTYAGVYAYGSHCSQTPCHILNRPLAARARALLRMTRKGCVIYARARHKITRRIVARVPHSRTRDVSLCIHELYYISKHTPAHTQAPGHTNNT